MCLSSCAQCCILILCLLTCCCYCCCCCFCCGKLAPREHDGFEGDGFEQDGAGGYGGTGYSQGNTVPDGGGVRLTVGAERSAAGARSQQRLRVPSESGSESEPPQEPQPTQLPPKPAPSEPLTAQSPSDVVSSQPTAREPLAAQLEASNSTVITIQTDPNLSAESVSAAQ